MDYLKSVILWTNGMVMTDPPSVNGAVCSGRLDVVKDRCLNNSNQLTTFKIGDWSSKTCLNIDKKLWACFNFDRQRLEKMINDGEI